MYQCILKYLSITSKYIQEKANSTCEYIIPWHKNGPSTLGQKVVAEAIKRIGICFSSVYDTSFSNSNNVASNAKISLSLFTTKKLTGIVRPSEESDTRIAFISSFMFRLGRSILKSL